ncbi:MAG: hypothetical protein WDW36_009810 [Sanguina aurantia]
MGWNRTVRLAQLDKEAAELRDENAALHRRCTLQDEAFAPEVIAQGVAAVARVPVLEREVAGLYKDQARVLGELVAAQTALRLATEATDRSQGELRQARADIVTLQEEVRATLALLELEGRSAAEATGELASSLTAREAAVSESERLRGDNGRLATRLMDLKEKEVDRMNEMNEQHEAVLAQAKAIRQEAAADLEAAQMIRSRLAPAAPGPSPGSNPSDAAPGPSPSNLSASQQQQQQSGSASDPPGTSLKSLMRLPRGGSVAARGERQIPKAPTRTVMAHKGGVCSLAVHGDGRLVASCGMDRSVSLWDLDSLDTASAPTQQLAGMAGAVNDVAFTSDGHQLIGAGADKSLVVWDVLSGQSRHTMTGHSAAVTGVAASPLESRLAASCSDDRSFKLWDLARGFCLKTMPCTKMPTALTMSRDGNTVVTGHVDGSLCLWDVRQCRGGSASPLGELREGMQAITCVTTTVSDSVMLACTKDGVLRLWDYRSSIVLRTIKHASFTVGTVGTIGRGRNHVGLSAPDGRFLAAGAADGGLFVWEVNAGAGGGDSLRPGGPPGGGGGGGALLLQLHKEAAVVAGWSADGGVLMSGDKAGVLAFWRLA